MKSRRLGLRQALLRRKSNCGLTTVTQVRSDLTAFPWRRHGWKPAKRTKRAKRKPKPPGPPWWQKPGSHRLGKSGEWLRRDCKFQSNWLVQEVGSSTPAAEQYARTVPQNRYDPCVARSLAGIYDYRKSNFCASKDILERCGLGSQSLRSRSPLLQRAWAEGIIMFKMQKGAHWCRQWPYLGRGWYSLPPRIPPRALGSLLRVAKERPRDVCTSWGVHVNGFLRKPPVEVLPALLRKAGLTGFHTFTYQVKQGIPQDT